MRSHYLSAPRDYDARTWWPVAIPQYRQKLPLPLQPVRRVLPETPRTQKHLANGKGAESPRIWKRSINRLTVMLLPPHQMLRPSIENRKPHCGQPGTITCSAKKRVIGHPRHTRECWAGRARRNNPGPSLVRPSSAIANLQLMAG